MALPKEKPEIRSTIRCASPPQKTQCRPFGQIIESRMPMDYRLDREGHASTPFVGSLSDSAASREQMHFFTNR
jgi:hypothetical protein